MQKIAKARGESKRMTWFRFYSEVLDDPKVQRLSPHLFRAWVNLLCLANERGGKLPSIDDIAFRLRVSPQDAEQYLSDLVMAGLIDIVTRGNAHETVMHGWEKRQFQSDTSTQRVRKYRKRLQENQRNGDETFRETAPDHNRTETDTEKKFLPSLEQEAPRGDEHDLNFDLKMGRKAGGGLDKIVRRAEGLGLDVNEMNRVVNENRPKNRPAYFTTLCVNRLRERLPGLDEQIIRDALWDKNNRYATVCNLLLEASP